MPKILSVGTALPEYEITQDQAKHFANTLFSNRFKDLNRLLKIFENTNIKKRHFCVPMNWFDEEHSFEEKNLLYKTNAIQLAKKAIKSALADSSYTPADIDHVIFVSSTGLSTPSIDAYLYNDKEINFNSNIKRTPIWGLGCAGGAAGLSRAFEYALAFPSHKILLIALEIGELAFLRNDLSKSNLVATSLFGDGAASVLIAGDQVKEVSEKELKIIDTHSTIWSESLDVMGWDVKNEGLKVIFSKDIPTIIRKELKPVIDQFLFKNSLSQKDINFFVLHPGGTKVIEAYQEIFGIADEKVSLTKHVLTEFGNMSSPTVLFVLKETLKQSREKEGYGLLLALGPGFSSEILLLRWE